MQSFKLRPKTILAFFLVGIVPLLAIHFITIRIASDALKNKAFNQLITVREVKKKQVEAFYSTLVEQMLIAKNDTLVKIATERLSNDFHLKGRLPGNWENYVAFYEPRFTVFIENFGWSQLMLVSPRGSIIYSMDRLSDLGQDIPESTLAQTSLGDAFEKIRQVKNDETVVFSDFSIYPPANHEPRSFAMVRVTNRRDELVGYLVTMITPATLNGIMAQRMGMENTGETYLVGSDKLMRSDSFINQEKYSVEASFKNPQQRTINSNSYQLAMKGNSGAGIDINYDGVAVLSAYTPINIGDLNWVMIAEISQQEAFDSVSNLRLIMILTIGFVMVLVIFMASQFAPGKALERAKKSMSLAKDEALKNKELSEALEIQVNQRTQELVRNNLELQKEIKEREKADKRLRAAHEKLVDNAHKAGMAEMAADTLHNVGNVLNSIKTSSSVIREILHDNPEKKLSLVCELIKKNESNIEAFLLKTPDGKKVIEYILMLDNEFKDVFSNISHNTERLHEKINTIAEIVAAQQSYAGTVFQKDSANFIDIIEDALELTSVRLNENGIKISKNFSSVPTLTLQKTKVLHTLVNLINNAIDALLVNDINNRLLDLKVYTEEPDLIMNITDNGAGITEDDLQKIFTHGYTTKENGFGFGLHSSANYLQEMGASIKAYSQGSGKGATFILTFQY